MGSTEPDIVQKAEAILAAAKSYKGDPSGRYGLMEQLDVLYKQLEDPMDAMIRQWNSVWQTNIAQSWTAQTTSCHAP